MGGLRSGRPVYADYGVKHNGAPTYAFIGSDDEEFQRLSSGFKADVAHPCSQMVPKYRETGLIEPWDPAKISELANIDPALLDSPYFKDDQGVWFLPADWGAAAVAYNKDEVPEADVASLQVFLDPKYAGRVSLPNSSDDVWALAFLATGKTDWNSVSDAEFKAAADWLRSVHPNVRSYWNDSAEVSQIMASGEVLVAWAWNDGVALLRAENFPIGYQREAKEGSSTWVCGYVNMKDGPGNEDEAYDFMNSWLSPTGAKALVDRAWGWPFQRYRDGSHGPGRTGRGRSGPGFGPTLAQTPKDNALHERMLQEFENIKAGF